MSKQGWRLRAVGFMGLGMTFLLAACGEDAVTNDPADLSNQVSEMSIDLALEDGGMSATDERPGFGDAYFSSYLGEDRDIAVVDDPLTTDERLIEAERRGDVEVKFVRVLWGNMGRGPEADEERPDYEPLDWTGGATVSDGILMPLQTIRFERKDHLIPPWRQEDPSRQKVMWVSHTGPGKDGVLLKIVIPAKDDDSLDGDAALRTNGDGLTEDDMFVFRTGPFTMEFPLSEIQDLDEVFMVDDRNGVSFVGFDRDDLSDMCPRGGMEGAWVRVENDDRRGGYFRARWVNVLGRVVGHVRGRWGVTDEGEKVFVGKIIGRHGEYKGYMRGHWEPSEDRPGRGAFMGQWLVRVEGSDQVRAKGAVRGAWAVSDRVEHGGFLRGMWKVDCNRDGDGTGAES